MKRKTFVRKMEERGYRVVFVTDGMEIHDGFGWRAFVSDKVRLGINTCSLELPDEVYNLINRYARTPLDRR